MIEFVYDTYAILEYLGKNQHYKKYFSDGRGITTKLNLMEAYYRLLKNYGQEVAETSYDSLLTVEYPIDDSLVKRAMQLRLEIRNSGKRISYVDAIGYQLALDFGAKFLTGDSAFENMINVEFVK